MAQPATYPPYQQPLLDGRSGLVSRPWQLFFLSLVSNRDLLSLLSPGSLPIATLEPIDSPRLLGRGSSGVGPVEEITIGAGLAMTGTELHATATGISGLGYWTPITNGDPLSPEILFDAEGDCVVGFVPTPE
jgi:hypothetical protein